MYTKHKAMKVVAGIDVGKFNLDVSVDGGRVRRFSNSQSGILELLTSLMREEVAVAVCEPTGGYERELGCVDISFQPYHRADELQETQIPVS